MKIGDHIHNLGARVVTIQILAFVLLAILGARIYYLQIVRGDYYSDRAESQRVRLIPIPAPGSDSPCNAMPDVQSSFE
jgi:penicillin-binding protein 2